MESITYCLYSTGISSQETALISETLAKANAKLIRNKCKAHIDGHLMERVSPLKVSSKCKNANYMKYHE